MDFVGPQLQTSGVTEVDSELQRSIFSVRVYARMK